MAPVGVLAHVQSVNCVSAFSAGKTKFVLTSSMIEKTDLKSLK